MLMFTYVDFTEYTETVKGGGIFMLVILNYMTITQMSRHPAALL